MYEPDKAEECPGACPALFRAWGHQGNRTLDLCPRGGRVMDTGNEAPGRRPLGKEGKLSARGGGGGG